MGLGLSLARLTLSASPLAVVSRGAGGGLPPAIETTANFEEDFSTYATGTLIFNDPGNPHIAKPFELSNVSGTAEMFYKRARVGAAGALTSGGNSPDATFNTDYSQSAPNPFGVQALLREGTANHFLEVEVAADDAELAFLVGASDARNAVQIKANAYGQQWYQSAAGATPSFVGQSGVAAWLRYQLGRAMKTGDRYRASIYGGKLYVQKNGQEFNPAGWALSSLGSMFGFGTGLDSWNKTRRPRYGAAAGKLFIDNDGAYGTANWRFYARKKDISATYPKGYRDLVRTGTYLGFAGGPLRLQWRLVDPTTNAILTAWTDPIASTIGSGVFSATLRIPAGITTTLTGADRRTGYPYALETSDGRAIGAGQLGYTIEYRMLVNNADTQIRARDRSVIAIAIGIVLCGQSNAQNQDRGVLSGVNVPDHPGVGRYISPDFTPPTLVPGYAQMVGGWDESTSEANGDGRDLTTGWFQLLAEKRGMPVLIFNIAVPATGAAIHNPESGQFAGNWMKDGLTRAVHFEEIVLAQGENEIAASGTSEALAWRPQWRDINIPNIKAYANQPAGVEIPVFLDLTGKYTTAPNPAEPSQSSILRREQEALAATPGYYLSAHPAGVTLQDDVHYDGTATGAVQMVRRNALTMIKVMTGEGYDGLGPTVTGVTRSGSTFTVQYDLNGADSLTTSTGTLTGLTGWQVNSAADFTGTNYPVTAAVLDPSTRQVTLTVSGGPTGPCYVRNYPGPNPNDSNWPMGIYADATIGTIHSRPLCTAALSSS